MINECVVVPTLKAPGGLKSILIPRFFFNGLKKQYQHHIFNLIYNDSFANNFKPTHLTSMRMDVY